MKTKTIKSNPVTEEVLDIKLSEMETRIDRKLDHKLDHKLETWSKQLVQDISDLFYEKLNALQNTQDKILAKFENWETENTVGTEQIRELRVDVDNHEIRLKSLETAKN